MAQLVSIVIPAFDAAPWIAKTIESALAQTWPHIEVFVVNDGSADKTLSIARQYESERLRVITQPNRGASAARNTGLRAATGDYIQFLDADDLLATDKIEQQMLALAAAPSGCVASGPWGRFDQEVANAVFTSEENWRDLAPIDWLALNFAGHGMMPPVAWLVPRSLVASVGLWDERLTLNDDGEYFCRLLLASTGIRFCPAARSYYRSNLAGSLSGRRTTAAWRSAFLSHELCVKHVLARENSPKIQRACADLFQRLAFAMYPDEPELVRKCEAQVRAHGGSTLQPGGGRLFSLLARFFGWKTARRLRH